MRPDNLVVVVLDNGVWGTGGGQEEEPTAFGLDLARLALATGWDQTNVHSPAGANELGVLIPSALGGGGPHFIVGKTSTDAPAPSGRPRPKRHQLDCAVLMRAELGGDGRP